MAGSLLDIRPFKVEISSDDVQRFQRKLRDTRLPRKPIVPDAGSDYGPSVEWIHRLYTKWLTFDFEKMQTKLSLYSHFLANIADDDYVLDIHFVHAKSSRPDAIPLILIHGWPGSFYEFSRCIEHFVNPSDSGDPAFDVVVPSLPGFCWSSGPPRRGWTQQDTARVFHKLMIGLGYTAYAAQAGDWGAFVARELGARFPACKAVHLNFCPTPMPESVPESEYTPREKAIQVRCQDWLDNHLGYAVCMRSRPHTIGFALVDNPMGILMWTGEKYQELTHPDFQSKHCDLLDEAILSTASLYYFTDCIITSSLPYFENVQHANFGTFFLQPENLVHVPLGYTSFMYDSRPSTKRAVERTGNLVFYNECDDGGHFAALERPDVILKDCRAFFGQYFHT